MPRKIKNPVTGRKIQVGGATYNNLVKKGYIAPKQKGAGKVNRIGMKAIKSPGRGRGGPTRGWRQAAPRSTVPRRNLLQKCGPDCFLLPDKLKFPICRACQANKCDCNIDCRGLLAAKIRARQHKYNQVADEADRLYKNKC